MMNLLPSVAHYDCTLVISKFRAYCVVQFHTIFERRCIIRTWQQIKTTNLKLGRSLNRQWILTKFTISPSQNRCTITITQNVVMCSQQCWLISCKQCTGDDCSTLVSRYVCLIFTARRYARCPSVHPSVRLSRRCIVSRRLKISSNFFLGQVAPSFCFLTPSADTQFQGEPLQRGHKVHGVGKICDCRLKSPFISETVRDRPMVAMKR